MKRHGHNAPLRKAKGKDADTSQCQRGLVVTVAGLTLAGLLGGVVITETVFIVYLPPMTVMLLATP